MDGSEGKDGKCPECNKEFKHLLKHLGLSKCSKSVDIGFIVAFRQQASNEKLQKHRLRVENYRSRLFDREFQINLEDDLLDEEIYEIIEIALDGKMVEISYDRFNGKDYANRIIVL